MSDMAGGAAKPTEGTWTEPRSKRRRLIDLGVWLLASAALLLGAGLMYAKFRNTDAEELARTAMVALLGLAYVAAVIGFTCFNKVSVRRFAKERTEVDFAYRLSDAFLLLLAGIGMPILIWTYVYAPGHSKQWAWAYMTLPLPLAALGIYLLLKKDRLVLSAQGKAAKDALEMEALRPELEFKDTEPAVPVVPTGSQQSSDSTDAVYPIGAMITGLVVFIGSWVYCIATYGFLLGVGLGWLPSLIVAIIAGFLWPLIALVIGLVIVVIAFFAMKQQ